MSFYFKKAIQCVFQGIFIQTQKKIRDFHIFNMEFTGSMPWWNPTENPHTPHRGNPRSNLYRTSPLAARGAWWVEDPATDPWKSFTPTKDTLVSIVCLYHLSIKNWMGPYLRTAKKVTRAIKYPGLGVRSVGPVGDFLESGTCHNNDKMYGTKISGPQYFPKHLFWKMTFCESSFDS